MDGPVSVCVCVSVGVFVEKTGYSFLVACAMCSIHNEFMGGVLGVGVSQNNYNYIKL